jgi:hypothetical protein
MGEVFPCLCGQPSTPGHRATCPVAQRAALAAMAWVWAMRWGGCSAAAVAEADR